MNDRIMTYLLVLFVFAGIASYDRYVVTIKKKPSPIMGMLKQSGLDKFKDTVLADELALKKKFRDKAKEKLKELGWLQEQVTEQRIQNGLQRDELLKQQIALTSKMEDLVTAYSVEIESQKGGFLKQFPQLDQFERNVEKAIVSRSRENLLRIYQNEKNILLSSLLEMTSDPLNNIPGLARVMVELDDIVLSPDIKAKRECGDILDCLKAKTREIRRSISKITNMAVQKPSAYLGAVLQESQMLQQENRILQRNADAIEKKINEILNEMQDNIRFIAEKITDLEDGDLEESQRVYRQAVNQWEELVGLLAQNSKRWLEAYQLSFYRLEAILPKVIDLGPEYGTISNACRSYIGQSQGILDDYVFNERTMERVFIDQHQKWQKFFGRIDVYLKGELEPLFDEEIEVAQEAAVPAE